MPGQRVILTYKDYEVLPADGRRYELHEGELSVTPAPSPQHQRIIRNLNEILWNHVKSRGLGEVFSPPLTAYWARSRWSSPTSYISTPRVFRL
jgi:Uma2 family endonuclease